MTRYVALYCRISQDKSGRVEGVKNQERWGREYATTTWPGVPVRDFSDNDISAANGDHRPAFEALREALGRGEVAHVWVVEQSRLERREAEWFRLAAELDGAGIAEVHTKRDGIVRVRDEVAGIKAVINAGEIRKMKARVNDRLAANAAKGIPAGSRPYGYVHGVDGRGEKTLVIVEAEADVIREAAGWVLAGWSLSSIATELRDRGLHGPHRVKVVDHRCSGDRRKNCGCPIVTEDGTSVEDGGKPVTRASTITNQSVKGWLTSPTVAGLRVHQGAVVGAGNWQAILDEATWRAVRATLAAPRVVQRSDGGTYPVPATQNRRTTGRRYLLTGGTAVCGVCGFPLIASMKQLKGGREVVPYYLCHPNKGGKGCVGIMGERFEAHVVEELFRALDKPAFREALAADAHAARRNEITAALKDFENQRIDLARMWARRRQNGMTNQEWEAAREVLAEDEQELMNELDVLPSSLVGMDPEAIREDWVWMELGERRAIISKVIERVTVKKAKPGTKGFDKGRVVVKMREW